MLKQCLRNRYPPLRVYPPPQAAAVKQAAAAVAAEGQDGLDSFRQLLLKLAAQGPDGGRGDALDLAFNAAGLGDKMLSYASEAASADASGEVSGAGCLLLGSELCVGLCVFMVYVRAPVCGRPRACVGVVGVYVTGWQVSGRVIVWAEAWAGSPNVAALKAIARAGHVPVEPRAQVSFQLTSTVAVQHY